MRSRRVSANQSQSAVMAGSAPARRQNAIVDRPHASNQGIQQMLRAGLVHAKLAVSQPGDRFEKEADRVAEQIVGGPASHQENKVAMSRQTHSLKKLAAPKVHRAALEGQEDEWLQTKRSSGQSPAGEHAEGSVRSLMSRGDPLPRSVRSYFEPRFGCDFGEVQIQTDVKAAEAAQAVNARAFTVGRQVVFGSGQYAPETTEGRKLLAHELAHVVQQSGETSSTLCRQVAFNADFNNINLANGAAATINDGSFSFHNANFNVDAEIAATADTQAELDEWDVGVFQDLVAHWNRTYWRRDNADHLGNFVERKYRPVNTRFRDQITGTVSDWYADDEHQQLAGVASHPVGARLEAVANIHHRDFPGGGRTVSGSALAGMNASDGVRNVDINNTGGRFDVWISAHNNVTGAWRHLRRLNWNYQRSLDFNGTGAALAVGTENWQLGHHGPYGAGAGAPSMAGDLYNTVLTDPARFLVRRVTGWT